MCFQIKRSDRAAQFSEKYFSSLYEAQKKWYVKNEKHIARHTKQAFDAVKAVEDFDANFKENLEFVKANLPEEILERVADLRVLALGCADYDTLQAITRYCGQVNRRCEKVTAEYDTEVERLADKIGWYKINSMNMLANAPVISAKADGDRFIIETSKEYTDYACKLTLFSPEISISDELTDAVILHYEVLPATEKDKTVEISLLCRIQDESFSEFSAIAKDFDIEEKF
jgi:hypothetical protein